MRDIAIEDLTVAEIMSTCPATIRLFIQRRLHCVGCPIARFHTLCDAAREHDIPETELIAAITVELNQYLTDDRA